MTINEVRSIKGMTRAAFENHLRISLQHDNVRRKERGLPEMSADAMETEIKERVERNYPTATECTGCRAWDSGMAEVNFVQGCAGCAKRMRIANGLVHQISEDGLNWRDTSDMVAWSACKSDGSYKTRILHAGGDDEDTKPSECPEPLHEDAVALVQALEHIVEYWNRDRNEDAMYDALWHIIETAEGALKSFAHPVGQPKATDQQLIDASNKGYAAGLKDGKALGACVPISSEPKALTDEVRQVLTDLTNAYGILEDGPDDSDVAHAQHLYAKAILGARALLRDEGDKQ